MNNKVYYTSKKEMPIIIKTLEESSFYIGEIDGKEIRQLQDYLSVMSEMFQFPFPSRSLDSYNDWMRDLDW